METLKNYKKVLSIAVAGIFVIALLFGMTSCGGGKNAVKVGSTTFDTEQVKEMGYLLAAYNSVDPKSDETTKDQLASINQQVFTTLERYEALKNYFAEKDNKDKIAEDWEKSALELAVSTEKNFGTEQRAILKEGGVTNETIAIYQGLYGYLQPAFQSVIEEKEDITDEEIMAYYKENKSNYKIRSSADNAKYKKYKKELDKLNKITDPSTAQTQKITDLQTKMAELGMTKSEMKDSVKAQLLYTAVDKAIAKLVDKLDVNTPETIEY